MHTGAVAACDLGLLEGAVSGARRFVVRLGARVELAASQAGQCVTGPEPRGRQFDALDAAALGVRAANGAGFDRASARGIERCPAWWGVCLSSHQEDGTGPATRWTGA